MASPHPSPPPRLQDLPAWLGVTALRGLARLPWRLQLGIGSGLGRLLMWLLPDRRRAARTNIALCFPELDQEARAALLRGSFRDLGIGVFEFARAWWGDVGAMRASATIEGVEKVRKLQAQGRGVLLISGHFMTLELCGRLMCDHVPLAGMYRRYRNPAMETAVLQGRLRYASAMFPNDDIRGAIRHLKKGGVLWYAPDQDMRGKDTVFAPFFGVAASTINATHQLARLTGCAVVPFFHRREGDRYILRVGHPLDPFPGDDTVADATAVNAAIEAMVREAPTQYLWIHRRFKRQPDGMSLYAR